MSYRWGWWKKCVGCVDSVGETAVGDDDDGGDDDGDDWCRCRSREDGVEDCIEDVGDVKDIWDVDDVC